MAIKIPVTDIISKIHEKTNLSEDEIKSKIKAKVEELSEYITEEGAAHIIANELGVKLFDSITGKFKINKLIAGMRSVDVEGKVLTKYDVREFTTKDGREGKVGNIMIGDDTGRVRCTFWGDKTDELAKMNEGDTIRITLAYTRLNNINRVEIHLGDASEVELNPPGVDVGEVAATPARPKATRKNISELTQAQDNIEIAGFVVTAYEPRFFEVDAKTGKRVRLRGDKYFDDDGNEVEPSYSCVMNVIVDDGTENIRVVCFKNQMLNMCAIGEGDLQSLKEDPHQFEHIKNNILGKPVKMIGRVVKNDMFDRIEFMSQLVFDADPKEELRNLE